MKKVALVFSLAVIVPSLVLAWLAARSLRDQEFLLQRQQSVLYQALADNLATAVQNSLADSQRAFTAKVLAMLQGTNPQELATEFDDRLRREWPMAQVGFVVTTGGDFLCPSPLGRPEARLFCANNSLFLANRESAEVYLNSKAALGSKVQQVTPPAYDANTPSLKNQMRSVSPQQQSFYQKDEKVRTEDAGQSFSKVAASAAEFKQLIGEAREGTVSRFVDNHLNVLFWCRPPEDARMVFGAQVSLPRLVDDLRGLVEEAGASLGSQVCVALLDDLAQPAALSDTSFSARWKRPFVASEIGEVLPHWEAAVYFRDPTRLTRSAEMFRLTFGLLIVLLLVVIGVGSWLIVSDLNRQLSLARQKTDFVSNVSHELKTPLTSIRMFSELLADGRVTDAEKQKSYLHIITAEAARLTRLINNVLDFARLERGQKRYPMDPCDLGEVVREAIASYRPHLEANGFTFTSQIPEGPLPLRGSADALAQIVVNLLSNAEKYAGDRKEVEVRVCPPADTKREIEVQVLDRGLGVPAGCEERIFEQFYRAHDSLGSGIQGSGLGLTLAQQIARAHGGDVTYARREGGGSIFTVRLPAMQP